MFFTFRTHFIHRPFASNATSCTTQQLLLRYQIPQYDRHHFPVSGILLIGSFSLSTKKPVQRGVTMSGEVISLRVEYIGVHL